MDIRCPPHINTQKEISCNFLTYILLALPIKTLQRILLFYFILFYFFADQYRIWDTPLSCVVFAIFNRTTQVHVLTFESKFGSFSVSGFEEVLKNM
jgi:hypothetical protein